jgi:putative cell wall-binding protein
MKKELKNMFKKTLALIFITVLPFSNFTVANASTTNTRLSGQTRYETAKAIAENYEQGKVKNVIFSTGNGFADALSASVLAHEKEAPILLVDTSVDGSKEAYDYVSRHLDLTGTVYIIGGTGVISKEFEKKLIALGFNNIVRVAGNDRYETSYQLANSLSSASTVVIASGESYPDALSISSFAANKGWPILLTPKNDFPQVMKNFLLEKKPSKVYIIGGTGVISDNVKSQINSILPQANIERLSGQDRFATNTIIAQTFKPNPSTIYVASGYGFADALAGSTLAAKEGNPIIFIDPSSQALPVSVSSYFKNLNANNVNPNIVAFGGTSVVPDTILNSVNNLILGKPNNDTVVSYAKYEEKMKTFRFDKLYNNKSAKSSELVTKTEALKLALSVTFNTNDISGFAEEHNEYDGAIWVEFAKYHKITTEDINITNYNDKAIYMDVISYFENCKIKFLKEKLVKEVSVNLNDISKYSSEQQAAIKDMIANGIISSLTSSLNGDTSITKGQLNELVVNFAEKYNTIAMKGDIITTDLDKMPSNVDKYAYILSNVDKYIYELPFTIEYQPDSRNPKELYAVKKNVYPQAREYSEAFFDSILNIDYKTITEESFENQIAPYTVLAPNKSAIKVYVKYVKDNQIVLEGKSSLQVPIIYSDGFSYRARLNLKFEIKHSKTKQNLLYLDFFEDSNKIYAKTSYDFLVDYYLTDKYKDTDMYLTENELYKTILQKDKCGITREIIK